MVRAKVFWESSGEEIPVERVDVKPNGNMQIILKDPVQVNDGNNIKFIYIFEESDG